MGALCWTTLRTSAAARAIGANPTSLKLSRRRSQINQMIRYAESNKCRMSALVCHFGDLADGQKACGICVFCAPQRCAAQRFRTATEAERAALFRAIAALRSGGVKSTGKLYNEMYPDGEMSRD